jgi:hypothetical protein
MSEHNFAAGVEMTMTRVVENYLRWFELNKAKKDIQDAGVVRDRRRLWLRGLGTRKAAPGWNLHTGLFVSKSEDGRHSSPTGEAYADPFVWLANRTSQSESHSPEQPYPATHPRE